MQHPVVIVPGIGGSGPEHWQSRWEAELPDVRRIEPASWDHPELDDWVAAIDRAVAASSTPPILVAHSLGCLAVAHWAGRLAAASPEPDADAAAPADLAAGAFLVAPPDIHGPEFPTAAPSFVADPPTPLPIRAVLITSSDDPYCAPVRAAQLAAVWDVPRLDVGAHGHINVASGFGEWSDGRRRFDDFAGLLAGAASPARVAEG